MKLFRFRETTGMKAERTVIDFGIHLLDPRQVGLSASQLISSASPRRSERPKNRRKLCRHIGAFLLSDQPKPEIKGEGSAVADRCHWLRSVFGRQLSVEQEQARVESISGIGRRHRQAASAGVVTSRQR